VLWEDTNIFKDFTASNHHGEVNGAGKNGACTHTHTHIQAWNAGVQQPIEAGKSGLAARDISSRWGHKMVCLQHYRY